MGLTELPVAKRHKLATPTGNTIRRPVEVFLISGFCAFSECAALYLLLQAEVTVPEFIALHAVVVFIAGIWFVVRTIRFGWSRSGLLVFGSTTLMGPFGALGCLYAFIVFWMFKKDAESFEDWYLTLFPDEEQDHAQALYDHIVSGRESLDERAGVVSFGDIMAYGSFEQKLAVLTLITKHFRPDFSAVLSDALKDDNAAIRVRAATAKAEIDNRYQERSLDLTAKLARDPDSAEANVQFARFLDEHAFSGLLSPDQMVAYRENALRHYLRAHELSPERRDVFIPIIRGFLRSDDTDGAIEWIAKARGNGVEEPGLDDWEMECLYRKKNFAALRDAARRHYSRKPDNTKPTRMVGGIVKLWADGIESPTKPAGGS